MMTVAHHLVHQLLRVTEGHEPKEVQRQDEEEEREKEREIEVRRVFAEQRIKHAIAQALHDDFDELRDTALGQVPAGACGGGAGCDAARRHEQHRESNDSCAHHRDNAEHEVRDAKRAAERGGLVEHMIKRVST